MPGTGASRAGTPLWRLAVPAVLVVLVAGCAVVGPPVPRDAAPRDAASPDAAPRTAEPVQLADAPTTPTAPVALDGPVGATGLFEPASWPRACALLDDAGLRAVLPQTGRIARTPSPGEVTVIGVGVADTVQIPEASCDIGVELPDKDFSPDGGYSEYSLRVDITFAGLPEMVELNQAEIYGAETETVLDGVRCLSSVATQQLTCTTPKVEFRVGRGSIGIPNPIDEEAVIRYVHDGRTEVFRRDGGVPEVERRDRYETEVVLPEIARVVLRNLGV